MLAVIAVLTAATFSAGGALMRNAREERVGQDLVNLAEAGQKIWERCRTLLDCSGCQEGVDLLPMPAYQADHLIPSPPPTNPINGAAYKLQLNTVGLAPATTCQIWAQTVVPANVNWNHLKNADPRIGPGAGGTAQLQVGATLPPEEAKLVFRKMQLSCCSGDPYCPAGMGVSCPP